MSVVSNRDLPKEEYWKILKDQLVEMMEKSEPDDEKFRDLIAQCKAELSKLQLALFQSRQSDTEEKVEALENMYTSFSESIGLAESLKISRGSMTQGKSVKLPKKIIPPKSTHRRKGGKQQRRLVNEPLHVDDSISPMQRDKLESGKEWEDNKQYQPEAFPDALFPETPANGENDGFEIANGIGFASAPANTENKGFEFFDFNDMQNTAGTMFDAFASSQPTDPFAASFRPSPLKPIEFNSVLKLVDCSIVGLPTASDSPSASTSYYFQAYVRNINNTQTQYPLEAVASTQSLTSTRLEANNTHYWGEALLLDIPKDISYQDWVCELHFVNTRTQAEVGTLFVPLASVAGGKGPTRRTFDGISNAPVPMPFKFTALFEFLKKSESSFSNNIGGTAVNVSNGLVAAAPQPGFAASPAFNMVVEEPSVPPTTKVELAAPVVPKTYEELVEELNNVKNEKRVLISEFEKKEVELEEIKEQNERLKLDHDAAIAELQKEKKLNALIKGELKTLDAQHGPRKSKSIVAPTKRPESVSSGSLADENLLLFPAELLSTSISFPPTTEKDWRHTAAVPLRKLINWPPAGITVDNVSILKSFVQYRELLVTSGGVLYEDEAIRASFTRRVSKEKVMFKIGFEVLQTALESFRVVHMRNKLIDELYLKPSEVSFHSLRSGERFHQFGSLKVTQPFSYPLAIQMSYLLPDGGWEHIPLRLPISYLHLCTPAHLTSKIFFGYWDSPTFTRTSLKTRCALDPKFREFSGNKAFWEQMRLLGAFALLDTINHGDSVVLASRCPAESTSSKEPSLCLAKIDRGSSSQTFGYVILEVRCASSILLDATVATLVSTLADNRILMDLENQFVKHVAL